MSPHRDRSHDLKYYGWAHQKARRAYMANAVGSLCVRCKQPIKEGDAVELDHVDGGKWNEYRGLAHKVCNRRAGGVRRQQMGRDPEPKVVTKW